MDTPKPQDPRKLGQNIVQGLEKGLEEKKAEFRPRLPHLTQRPFHTAGLISFRDSMNIKIKNK